MNIFRWLLITLTLGAFLLLTIVLSDYAFGRSFHHWSDWAITIGVMIGLALNGTYLLLDRRSSGGASTEPASRSVNKKALAYIGAACVVAWFVADISVKIHSEQRLTALNSRAR